MEKYRYKDTDSQTYIETIFIEREWRTGDLWGKKNVAPAPKLKPVQIWIS